MGGLFGGAGGNPGGDGNLHGAAWQNQIDAAQREREAKAAAAAWLVVLGIPVASGPCPSHFVPPPPTEPDEEC
jgi:hypothetical protein